MFNLAVTMLGLTDHAILCFLMKYNNRSKQYEIPSTFLSTTFMNSDVVLVWFVSPIVSSCVIVLNRDTLKSSVY
jgi:hypothetical protein